MGGRNTLNPEGSHVGSPVYHDSTLCVFFFLGVLRAGLQLDFDSQHILVLAVLFRGKMKVYCRRRRTNSCWPFNALGRDRTEQEKISY